MFDWKYGQNGDGGWAYNKGCSWTEPTAFVLLAQSATQLDRSSFEAGVNFCFDAARGWRLESAARRRGEHWVTVLAALLPEQAIGRGA